ncbi:UNVERIFIED_CONTAM: hypothetical protein Sradi_3545800 [Sesamum radiatum]|uniref:Uncharacterized protein n=1 Tax=Sesamum radiatum TaxID=300843 RepID=A0AAW2QGA6_SESRA
MITGEPVGGDSHHARKAKIRRAHSKTITEVLDVEAMEETPVIQFGRAERSGPRSAHNDALVITALLANHEVERIFIDSESSADILFGEAFDQMQLGDAPLEEVNTSLYGFAGEVVHPRGLISLPLTLEAGPTQKTCVLKFLVVDVPSAYNVILGRPTLNMFQAVISMYHMKIKFLLQEEWGSSREILCNPEDVIWKLCGKDRREVQMSSSKSPLGRREAGSATLKET